MDTGQLELRSAVAWRDGRLEAIDQTLLPERLVVLELRTVAEVVDALRRLAIRGAPAIGVAAAFAVVLGLDERRPSSAEQAAAALDEIAAELEAARPTAVNLSWAVRRVAAAARGDAARGGEAARAGDAAGARDAGDPAQVRRRALEEAERVLEEDRASCRRMAEFGRTELTGRRRLLTHCNTGRLATAGLGTALGVVYAMSAAGEPVQVLASETRPLLQGARLTAWELLDAGIPVTVLAEGAAGAAMARGMVEAVLVGCDRVARSHGIPFYVVGPLSSFDPQAADGDRIVIEERSADELRGLAGVRVAPAAAHAWNPAFDVTPAELVSGFITDAGVLRPPFAESIARVLGASARPG